MRIPPRLARVLSAYALSGAEWLVGKIAARLSRRGAERPLAYRDVEHIRSQVDSATRAARANAKTVIVPRTPNRYDE